MIRRLQILFVITGILLLGLTGCGHEHVWEDAACIAPKTCSECGETEGEALGHTWVDATCSAPKTCSVCGETEGEPLEHTWIAANYQDPKTCSICGETEGNPLTASFEEHGLTINAEEDTVYDYFTTCYEDPSKETVGHVTFSDYQIIEEDENLGLERKEGYEWHTVHITVLYDDDNACDYGYQTRLCTENYYDIEGWDNTSSYDETTERTYHTVNYHGTDYECCYFLSAASTGWVNETLTITYDMYHNVPIGYDGVVQGFYNAKTSWEDGMYIYDVADENSLFFRME